MLNFLNLIPVFIGKVIQNAAAINNLAGAGRTNETVKGNADNLEDLAGAGRTNETVKGNADTLATMSQQVTELENSGVDTVARADTTEIKAQLKATGKNLFNIATITTGKYINWTNGSLATSASYNASDFIPVLPNTYYSTTAYSVAHGAFYNASQTFISGTNSWESLFKTPANCYYVRFSAAPSNMTGLQMERGAYTTYEAYGSVYKVREELPAIDSLYPQLPVYVPAVVGHEVNVYFSSLINAFNINDYQFNVTCDKGKQQSERWTYTPVAEDVGTISFKVSIYKNGVYVNALYSNIVVVAANAGTNVAPKTLLIGDSTLANNQMITELKNLFDVDSTVHPVWTGTRGGDPIWHEGISGWTVHSFYTSDVTFVFSGSFNFAQYLTSHSFTVPDLIVFNLGINDVFGFTTDTDVTTKISEMKTEIDAMITNMKISNANAKFGICLTIPPCSLQDAFGDDYGNGQTAWRYRLNNSMLVNELVKYYSGKEASNIYIFPINVNLDTVHNMGVETVAVNSRNATTVVRANSGVHPDSSGYYQIADMMYYKIKSII